MADITTDYNTSEESAKNKFGKIILPFYLKASYILIAFGILAQSIQWPFVSQFFILGFGALACCSLIKIFFTHFLWEKAANGTLAFLSCELLFKLMVWKGLIFKFDIGLVSSIILMGINFYLNPSSNKELTFRATFLILFGLIVSLLPPKTFFQTLVHKDPKAAQLYEIMAKEPQNATNDTAFYNYFNALKKRHRKTETRQL